MLVCITNSKSLSMKKLLSFAVMLFFPFLTLSSQIDKKDPVLVIDGKISNVKLSSIKPSEITSLNISVSQKDKDMYGPIAENGVIRITTNHVNIESQKKLPALVLVNGEIYTKSLDSINVRDIESVSFKSDKSFVSRYGKEAQNGVMMIKLHQKTSNNK